MSTSWKLNFRGTIELAPPPSGVTLVAHTAMIYGGGAATITTPAVDTTGASLLVAILAGYTAMGSLSDSLGNAWTPLTVYTSGSYLAQLLYCAAPTVGAGHTFTNTGGSSYPALAVAAFAGTPHGASATADTGAGGSGTVQPGAATPPADGALLVSGLAYNQNIPVAIDSGFQITDTLPTASSMAVALAWLQQPHAAAVDPAWTGSGLAGTAAMAAFPE